MWPSSQAAVSAAGPSTVDPRVWCPQRVPGWELGPAVPAAAWVARHPTLRSRPVLRSSRGNGHDGAHDGVVVIGLGGVGHDYDADVQLRVEAHGVPEAAAGAPVLDESGTGVAVRWPAKPAQSEVERLARRADVTHRAGRVGGEDVLAVDNAVGQVQPQESGRVLYVADQSAVAGARDPE